jgi:hypothetical protein
MRRGDVGHRELLRGREVHLFERGELGAAEHAGGEVRAHEGLLACVEEPTEMLGQLHWGRMFVSHRARRL